MKCKGFSLNMFIQQTNNHPKNGSPLPSATARTIVVKSSSARTTSAASLATSVPPMPIAMPMSAAWEYTETGSVTREQKVDQAKEPFMQEIRVSEAALTFSAVASFTPSPVIATTSPRF